VGGVLICNKKGQIVLWFKGKDPDDAPSFALCLYWSDLVDDMRMRRQLGAAFSEIKEVAKELGLPLFNAAELEAQMQLLLGKDSRSAIGQEFQVFLTDLVTGRRGRLTIKVHPPEAA
jgi:hypothetical protein